MTTKNLQKIQENLSSVTSNLKNSNFDQNLSKLESSLKNIEKYKTQYEQKLDTLSTAHINFKKNFIKREELKKSKISFENRLLVLKELKELNNDLVKMEKEYSIEAFERLKKLNSDSSEIVSENQFSSFSILKSKFIQID